MTRANSHNNKCSLFMAFSIPSQTLEPPTHPGVLVIAMIDAILYMYIWQCPINKSALSRKLRVVKKFSPLPHKYPYMSKMCMLASNRWGVRILPMLVRGCCCRQLDPPEKSPWFGVHYGHGWARGRICGITWALVELVAPCLEQCFCCHLYAQPVR